MSTTPTFERASAATEPDRTKLHWPWIVTLIVVIAVAGITLSWLALSGDDEPEQATLTFDGSTATYTGPTTLEAGIVTLTLENTHDSAVGPIRIKSTDPNLTLEEAKAWEEANPAGTAPWFGGWDRIGVGAAGETSEYDVSLPEGRQELLVRDVLGGIYHPAAIIEVTGG